MKELSRPFLNDENYKTVSGKTRQELRELRRQSRPTPQARPAIRAPEARPEPGTLEKIGNKFFPHKKKTEPEPRPEVLTKKETKELLKDTKKTIKKTDSFFKKTGIKETKKTNKPKIKTKGFKFNREEQTNE